MTGGLVVALFCLILPVMALVARRLPIRQVVLLVVVWTAIFAAGYVVAEWLWA